MLRILALTLVLACSRAALAGSLTVNVLYPEASMNGNDLTLRGDNCGLSWDSGTALQKTAENTWSVTLQCDAADGIFNFKALRNDQDWMQGANAMTQIPSGSATVSVYPWFDSVKGEYSYVRKVHSPELGNDRDLVVYVPPSYHENTLKPYKNVLVMHDGENLFDPNTSFLGVAWMCQNTVNELVFTGAMEEIVIVGIDNTMDRTDEYTYSYDKTEKAGGKGDKYLDFIEKEVFPRAASAFDNRFDLTKRENVGMAGSSLGGLLSCYAGWTRPQVYSKVACMSSSFWWNSQDFNNTVIPSHAAPKDVQFYLDSGDSGPGNDDKTETLLVRSDMENLGFTNSSLYYYLDHGGKHSEQYWGARFHIPMADLYPPSLIPHE